MYTIFQIKMAREIALTQFSPTWMGGDRNKAHQIKLWKAPDAQ